MAEYKRIPYGISNFRQLRRDNFYYVDKTMYIRKLEEAGNFLFLIRPRRFGKSLFLNMLCAYYDREEQGDFDTLFDGLYVKEHPTAERGMYQVLRFDFSQTSGGRTSLYERVNSYCNIVMDGFLDRYAHLYPAGYAEKGKAYTDFNDKLSYINFTAKVNGLPIYLIIDEYDNFTNAVLNEEGEKVYHELTHATGFYRGMFKKFKDNCDRILMLGVSPVTMDDLTSGYNIATSITMNPVFNMMLGFSEEDVRQMIRYYQSVDKISRTEDDIISEIKPWYNNYCFAKASLYTDPKMFNSDMVLYYMNQLIQTGHSPEQMTDPNTRTDYSKMRKLIRLDGTGTYRTSIINKIAEQGYILGNVEESFPAEQLTKQEMFVSLLYYYGMLTMGENMGSLLKLIIPNNNVRRQYYDYLLEEYQRIHHTDTMQLGLLFHYAAVDGQWQPLMDYIAQAYHDATAVRSLIEGERNLQGFMNAYLTLTPYYLTAPELELSHGYCDFFLLPDLMRYPMIRHSYIIELKYLAADDSEEKAERQWQEAVGQIQQYAQDEKVRLMCHDTTLHRIVAQTRGYKMLRIEEV